MLTPEERRRWTLILGTAQAAPELSPLNDADRAHDQLLSCLFDQTTGAGHGVSAPYVARWLQDLRTVLPKPVLQWIEREAWDRWGPEPFLQAGPHQPDVAIVEQVLRLRHKLNGQVKEQAKTYVRRWAEEFRQRHQLPWQHAVTRMGALVRSTIPEELDWDRTILENLKQYQPSLGTIIPATLHWKSHRRRCLGHLIMCVDQSGSMLQSLAYTGLFASILASLPTLRTSIVAYDTSVVDLSHYARQDPVEMLFGVQLGGGNDTPRALDYCSQLVTRPSETLLVVVSDLIEGALSKAMLQRLEALHQRGMRLLVVPALTDRGEMQYDRSNAQAIADLGIPVAVCTPGEFHRVLERAWNG